MPHEAKSSVSASTTLIVVAYLRNNHINAADLSLLVSAVSFALAGTPSPALFDPQRPAVALRRLVTPDHVFCAECGKSFKSLKRHLRVHHDLTPAAYRAKWHLKSDHPMVAPNYAATRSELAKSFGLGRKPSPKPVRVSAKATRPKAISTVTAPVDLNSPVKAR